MNSFLSKELQDKSVALTYHEIVYNNDEKYFWYLAIPSNAAPLYIEHGQRADFDPATLGFTVLAEGRGEPSESVEKQMKEKYGIDRRQSISLS